jgi:hypothetical protein
MTSNMYEGSRKWSLKPIRIHLVLIDIQNRILGPYLVAIQMILIPVTQVQFQCFQ